MLGVAGVNVAFPGVASAGFFLSKQRDHHENQQTSSRHRDDVGVKQVKYYQWVAFVLILQVIFVGKYIKIIFLYINMYINKIFTCGQ